MIRDLRGQCSPKDDPSQVCPTASSVGKVVTSCFQQELGFEEEEWGKGKEEKEI